MNKLKCWKIGKRISVGFAIVIGLALALGAVAYGRLNAIGRGAASLALESLPALSAMSDINSNARENYIRTLEFLIVTNAETRGPLAAGNELGPVSAALILLAAGRNRFRYG